MMAVRVLIIDDSAMMRSFLREILSSDPAITVVGVASCPMTARQKIKSLDPDVITLDIEMPGMDGLTFLEHLMRLRPMPVIMVSSMTQKGAQASLRALELGAIDFVAKPVSGLESGWPEFRAEVIGKIKSAVAAMVPFEVPVVATPAVAGMKPPPRNVVALGGSTGSVMVLQHIISAMPLDGPAMLVVVHMPAQFTKQFADRLDGICAIRVCQAEEGMAVLPGQVCIAPGDRHLTVRRKASGIVCRLEDGPNVNGHKPSVDVLFDSVASAAGANSVGVILSGMGRDGALGLRALREAGAATACQDKATCLIYGMPAAAVAEGAVEEELPVSAIPSFILRRAAAVKPARKVMP